MPDFIIERNMPEVGQSSSDQLQAAATSSCDVLRALGPEIQWVHSHVVDDKIYCLFRAPSEDLIREHAQRLGVPADAVSRVRATISPTTAE